MHSTSNGGTSRRSRNRGSNIHVHNHHSNTISSPHNSISSPRSNNIISSKQTDLRNIGESGNRKRATAASGATTTPMRACTNKASHNTKGKCAAVSSSLAPVRGMTNTAVGASAAAITGTEFLKTATGSTSGISTTFE